METVIILMVVHFKGRDRLRQVLHLALAVGCAGCEWLIIEPGRARGSIKGSKLAWGRHVVTFSGAVAHVTHPPER